MHHTIDFLLKFFVFATVSCGYMNIAMCEGSAGSGTNNQGETSGTDIGGGGLTPGDGNTVAPVTISSSSIITKTLCPAGQYVYKCGNYRVGFEWLKGMPTENEITTQSDCENANGTWDTTDSACTTYTDSYYTSNNQSELLEQMRNFFNAKSGTSMEYCASGDETPCSDISSKNATSDRNTILNSICNPFDSNITVTCAYCPESANVDASVVRINTTSKKVISWAFHTVADCYMKDFTDSTGTYSYVEGATQQKCYYANTNTKAFNTLYGDSLKGFAPGTINNSTTTILNIPTSGTISFINQ